MWKHIKGNRVSKAINLKVYTTDTGDEVHYFQKPGLREPDSVKEVEIPIFFFIFVEKQKEKETGLYKHSSIAATDSICQTIYFYFMMKQ